MTPDLCARLACIGLVLLAAGCGLDARSFRVEGSFERTLQVEGPVNLEVQTGSGDIQVRTGDEKTVRIIGRIHANGWARPEVREEVKRVESDPPIQQSGNSIRVGGPRDWWSLNQVTISYEITVPVETRLRTRSGSGDQWIDGMRGPVDAGSGSGRVRIGRTSSEVEVSVGSGDIEVESTGGSLVARAGSGSVRAAAVAGAVSARTGSGDVEVVQTAAGGVDITTGSGDVFISGARGPLWIRASSGDVVAEGEPVANWKLGASSGDVSVRVPETAAFDVDVHTSSGDIQTDQTLLGSSSFSRHRLQGRVRGGGPLVEVKTSSGSVHIGQLGNLEAADAKQESRR
jgi:DUF4097 and DUF4098 domain-containing protein YvlB